MASCVPTSWHPDLLTLRPLYILLGLSRTFLTIASACSSSSHLTLMFFRRQLDCRTETNLLHSKNVINSLISSIIMTCFASLFPEPIKMTTWKENKERRKREEEEKREGKNGCRKRSGGESVCFPLLLQTAEQNQLVKGKCGFSAPCLQFRM